MRFKQFLKEAVPEPGERYVLKTPFDCAREFGGSTYLNAGTEIEVIRIQDSPFGMQVVYKIVDEPGTYTEGLRWFAKIMFRGTKDDWNKTFLDDLKESTQEEPILCRNQGTVR